MLILSLAALAVCLCYIFQRENAMMIREGRALLAIIDPILGKVFQPALWIMVMATSLTFIKWTRLEWKSVRKRGTHLPRWTFLISTICLLAIFVVFGPLTGFLCFAFSHAVEYIAFVHHFESRRAPRARGDQLHPLWRLKPISSFLLLLIPNFLIFYFLFWKFGGLTAVLIYVGATSLIHFLFDGWIWRVRQPTIRNPLLA